MPVSSNHPRLSDKQSAEAFAFCQSFFNSHPRMPGRVRAAKRAAREHFTSIGWEQILIDVVVQVVAKMIAEWIKKKFQEAPSVMPIGFSEAPMSPVSDDDPDSD